MRVWERVGTNVTKYVCVCVVCVCVGGSVCGREELRVETKYVCVCVGGVGTSVPPGIGGGGSIGLTSSLAPPEEFCLGL